MPFIAKDAQTGERIDITKLAEPRKVLSVDRLVCQCCGWPMTIRSGLLTRAHFAHKPGREDCPYVEYIRGKTPEHWAAQEALRDYLGNWVAEYSTATAELEVIVPNAIHKRNRIADVMFAFPGGWRVAHEVQLASITIQELQERTEDYANAGVDVEWWFGRDADTITNRQWSYDTYGNALRILIGEEAQGKDTIIFGRTTVN